MKKKFDVFEFLSSESLFGVTTGRDIAYVIEVIGDPEDKAIYKKYNTITLKYGHLEITIFDGIVIGIGIDIQYINLHKLSKYDVFYFSKKTQKATRCLTKMLRHLNNNRVSYRIDTAYGFPEQKRIYFPGKKTFISYVSRPGRLNSNESGGRLKHCG